MISKYLVILAYSLFTTHVYADTTRNEASLFLEYEREVSRSDDITQDESTPFKKIVKTITPSKPKTPYTVTLPIITPIQNIPTKPPIGHDDLPYIVINKPLSSQANTANSCRNPIQNINVIQADEKPKKSLLSNFTSVKERILARAKEFLGTPYGFGSKESIKTDCSGFTQQVFEQFGVALPHSAAEQAQYGSDVDSNDLQVGDLLFYQTYKDEPSHVAIYAGDGQIIHASFKNKRVQYDAIDKGYYKKHFMYAKRLALSTPNNDSLKEQ
jgi:cell wall-associated NlpC family hydrolase